MGTLRRFFTSPMGRPCLMGQGGPGEGDPLPSINADLVKEHLERLDTFKSAGPDGLHPRVLKELASIIAQPLAQILESSWRSGEVPEDWKTANVVPIFKKGRKVGPANYRPISLTSVLGKVLEKIIKEAILNRLADGNILRGSQHGSVAGNEPISILGLLLGVGLSLLILGILGYSFIKWFQGPNFVFNLYHIRGLKSVEVELASPFTVSGSMSNAGSGYTRFQDRGV
ncbi:small integral membrane protein 35 isoform X2 [Alligator mississippiensis]|uniref:small integral membrane protein 35 isoform X2 n=1 Tax=Alligator mississippiensis TaxID=8496 RepID=UPI002877C038|nr:small integral membrane protein 35 isoform X2 [Alligator mississippiensis]